MQETTYGKLRKFGQAIRTERKELGLSQEDFAERCNLDRTYIGEIERAEVNVSFENITRIADALSLRVSDLFLRAKL
jgi:transcriptional regulator with XRE-family HTH domain